MGKSKNQRHEGLQALRKKVRRTLFGKCTRSRGQAARGRQEVERQGVVIEGRQQDVNEVEEAGD